VKLDPSSLYEKSALARRRFSFASGLLLRHTGVQSFDTLAEFEIVLCRPEVMDAAWGAILLGEGLIAVPPAPTFPFAGCFVRKVEASPIKGAGDHADSDRRFSAEAQTDLCGRRVAQHRIAQAQATQATPGWPPPRRQDAGHIRWRC